MTIHTFGDSHSTNGWNNVDGHHLGPRLCYNFGKKKLEVCDIRVFKKINDGDILIFSFGEIDCRCHVHKHINENNSYQKIIEQDDFIDYLQLISRMLLALYYSESIIA